MVIQDSQLSKLVSSRSTVLILVVEYGSPYKSLALKTNWPNWSRKLLSTIQGTKGFVVRIGILETLRPVYL